MPIIENIGVLDSINLTYPVAYIVMFLAGFGAALAGFARRPYFKNQNRIIENNAKLIERLAG